MNQNNYSSTPYDDAFHTMVQRSPELLIPLVNELFQANFQRGDEVIIQSSDLPSVDDQDGVQRRFSDSLFSIKGAETRLYHIECESKSDGSIVIRMVEYGFHKALRDAHYEDGELIVEMPNSAVIFLRHNQNTPDRFRVRIITPGGECDYPIEVLKIGQYSLEEIFQKELLFLLPFHFFSYEKDLSAINEDPKRLEEFIGVYGTIMQRIGKLCESGELSANSEELLHSMMRHVLNGVARNYDIVRKVGDTMLGRVIDDDFTRMLDKMDEVRRQVEELESQKTELESRKAELEAQKEEAEARKEEAEAQKAEVEAQKAEVEAQAARIQRAVERLTEQGRAEQIIRLYQNPAFLGEVLEEIE